MSDCRCNPTEITPTPCVPIVPETGCNRIRMFFGHSLPNTKGTKFKPGQLQYLYYTPEINNNHIKYGFLIEDYSAQELVDNGILPNLFGKFISSNPSNLFDLSELELLATATWESWTTLLTEELVLIKEADLSSTTSFRTFGFYCLKALDFDLVKMRVDGFKAFQSLKDGDTSGIAAYQKSIINVPRTSPSQQSHGEYYPSTINLAECDQLHRASDIEKLVMCYEWIKKIHDTYYGKEFLVKIGEPVPISGAAPTYACIIDGLPTAISQEECADYGGEWGTVDSTSKVDTLCIKDENGNYPSFQYPFFIDGDGSAQGYFLSDTIDNSGGFPDANDQHIIGLYNLDWIQTESGKIGGFAKIGKYGTLSANCSGIYQQVLYPKFATAISQDPLDILRDQWKINIADLNPDSFYLSSPSDTPTKDTQYLYMSVEVSEKFYVDNYGTWVHFRLSDKVSMSKVAPTNAQGFIDYQSLSNALQTIPGYDTSVTITQNIATKYLTYCEMDVAVHGARGNVSILNTMQTNSFCLIPEAVAIPFKSNLYKYGPFYYGNDEAGGVDVIFDDDIAPWNFIQANKNSLPLDYAYDSMHDIATAVASGSPRDLQKLEKGRITVAGLPCYCLAHWVDNPECYSENELGPTLLTDISVEYGAGGFNTTYNFSTYTPRLGRTEKYINEAWKNSIKDTQYLVKYLNSLETQLDRTNQSYKLRLINGEHRQNLRGRVPDNFYASPKIKKDTTLNTLMFSGYQLLITPTPSPDFDDYNIEEQYETVPSNYPEDSYCGEYVCTTPTPITYTPIVYTPYPNRMYTFSGTDKAYTIEYIQNTYHQLSGMSLDGFHLPVSLRGANKDPRIKEYLKYDDNGAQPNQFILSSDKLQYNPSWENNARVPRFAKRCNNNGDFVEWDKIGVGGGEFFTNANTPGYPIPSKTRDEIPPFKLNGLSYQTDHNEYCYGLDINQKYLNPFLSEKNLLGAVPPFDNIHAWDDRKNDSTKGFVISSILFGQDHIDYQITHTNPDVAVGDIEAKDTDEFIRQQFKNFRFPAMRGPLVLQGWGYDTSGKPIPNSADGYGHAQMGEFRKENLTDKFMQNWLQNPKSWPVGPVDLRFDRERGVWTCPSPNKIVVARLKERLNKNSSAKAELINPEAGGIRFYENYSISGPNGENVKLNMEHTEITVYDFLGIELCQCDVVYAYYDDNRYIVLESNRSYMDPNEVCIDITCTTTTPTETTPTETTSTPPCDWCGLECLQGVPNYNSTVEQILGHDNKGCLKWFDVTDCSTPQPQVQFLSNENSCNYYYDTESKLWNLYGNTCTNNVECPNQPLNPPSNPEEVIYYDEPCS